MQTQADTIVAVGSELRPTQHGKWTAIAANPLLDDGLAQHDELPPKIRAIMSPVLSVPLT